MAHLPDALSIEVRTPAEAHRTEAHTAEEAPLEEEAHIAAEVLSEVAIAAEVHSPAAVAAEALSEVAIAAEVHSAVVLAAEAVPSEAAHTVEAIAADTVAVADSDKHQHTLTI